MLLRTENIHKTYYRNTGSSNYFYAVAPTSLDIPSGTVSVLMGRSGSGKTTLLNMLAGILEPTEGKVLLNGTDLYSLNDAALSRFRNEKIGVVPQARSAVDTLTVMENILLPATLFGHAAPTEDIRHRLEELDIGHLENVLPRELSGGELRRMAIVRAMVRDPDILFADEPTSALDVSVQKRVVEEMVQMRDHFGTTIIIVTHNIGVVRAMCDKCLVLQHGNIMEYGDAKQVIDNPQNEYTKKLMDAVPRLKKAV